MANGRQAPRLTFQRVYASLCYRHIHTCAHGEHRHVHAHTHVLAPYTCTFTHKAHTCKHMHTHIYMHKVTCVCMDQLCFQPGLLPRRGCSPVRCLEGTHLCHPFLPFFPPVTLTLAQTPCVTFKVSFAECTGEN